MSLPVEQHRYTVEEYLEIERRSEAKHEFRDGQIVAMAGASHNHVLVAANFVGEIRNALKGKPCRAYGSDLKVGVVSRGEITYPDGSIICGSSEFHPAAGVMRDAVINPRVLIEVLSPSTEQHDRTTKFDLYRDIPSFEEYVLVAQDSPRVETYRRYADGSWRFEVFVGIEAVTHLATVDVSVPLREIYAGVIFPPAPVQPA